MAGPLQFLIIDQTEIILHVPSVSEGNSWRSLKSFLTFSADINGDVPTCDFHAEYTSLKEKERIENLYLKE